LEKVMLCTDEAPLLLMIKTGGEADGEVGLAGERETIALSGRAKPDEPGKRVVGEPPQEGVRTRDEAECGMVTGDRWSLLGSRVVRC
jgi:hypothetical protein